jgi:hypothetical protein
VVIAMEDFKAEFFFALPNLSAHSGLRNVQLFRRFTEVQLTGDGEHILELANWGNSAHEHTPYMPQWTRDISIALHLIVTGTLNYSGCRIPIFGNSFSSTGGVRMRVYGDMSCPEPGEEL